MLILAAFLLHTTTALAADNVVGTATLDLQDSTTGRKVTSELWFKTAADARIEQFSPRPPLRAIPIAPNAEPQPPLRKQPLIMISHGNWGSRFSQGWLALELVKSGYVVLSTSHPGTVSDDQSAAGRYRLWDRSRDVSFALDEVLKTPKWAALIDHDRIGFVGHSFGGWTGVSLAGGRYDAAGQRAFCANSRTKRRRPLRDRIRFIWLRPKQDWRVRKVATRNEACQRRTNTPGRIRQVAGAGCVMRRPHRSRQRRGLRPPAKRSIRSRSALPRSRRP